MSKPKIVGVNERWYPAEIGYPVRRVSVKVVLVAGDIGDYAAYAGQGTDEWVAQFGDKISFQEACIHFPGGQLKKEKYRE